MSRSSARQDQDNQQDGTQAHGGPPVADSRFELNCLERFKFRSSLESLIRASRSVECQAEKPDRSVMVALGVRIGFPGRDVRVCLGLQGLRAGVEQSAAVRLMVDAANERLFGG